MMTIGEFARTAGVSVDTLRFYERRGLLEPAKRTNAGYRLYDEGCLGRLRFIQKAKELGFTLAEVARVIAIMEAGQPLCTSVHELLENKLAEIERQMLLLEEMRRELVERLAWARAHPDPDCAGEEGCVYFDPPQA